VSFLTDAKPMVDLLDSLNPPQKEAVLTTEGPVLVLAGAGSGKTRVLTFRIAHLISSGLAPPHGVLAMTFTNKAAGEMKERVKKLLGVSVPWVTTFHSFCARMLRDEAPAIGYPSGFSIYDEEDSQSVIKKVLNSFGRESKEAGRVLAKISDAKSELIEPEEFARWTKSPMDRWVGEVYRSYQKELLAAGAMDFDDLLMKAHQVLANNPDILARWQGRFGYILVDEYQDTNFAQYRLLKLLAGRHRNLFVVGDDDQSIYGWRGARLSNILDFEKDFPETKIIRLEQNYRSTQTILSAASAVVAKNRLRKGKSLWTSGETGEQLFCYQAADEAEEGFFISQEVEQLTKKGVSLSQVAVLYRTNAQSRALEDAFRYRALPYILVGGVRFYQRKEVKDLLAYLKFIENQADLVAFERLLSVPARGIGKESLKKITEWANAHNMSVWDAFKKVSEIEGVSTKTKNAIAGLVKFFEQMDGLKGRLPLNEFILRVLEGSGLAEMLAEEDKADQKGRLENAQELGAAGYEFLERNPEGTLSDFLGEVALLTDLDRWDPTTSAVTLMTLHQAKGLEFETVFLAGLEEGLFPLSRTLSDPAELEEERRLFYVGLTRAKKKVSLSFCSRRHRFGETFNLPSRFLEEIPADLVKREGLAYPEKYRGQSIADKPYPRAANRARSEDSASTRLRTGSQILHPTFGQGQVLGTEGEGEALRVWVRFSSGETKKLFAKYASLKVIRD